MKNICEFLFDSAEKYPNKTAFVDTKEKISFGELLTDSRKIATYFLRNEEIDAKSLFEGAVCFYMEKSVKALQVMFGSVFLGAFYSFIDVRQTHDRALNILNTLEPVLIVTDEENINVVNSLAAEMNMNSKVILISELFTQIEGITVDEEYLDGLFETFYDRMPLYVNFTSGSTGVPKGVTVCHGNVIGFIGTFTKTFGITSEDVIANQAPFDFDVSVKDIYSGILTGATVCLIPREYFVNPVNLMDYLCEQKVTTIIWAVSAMCFVAIMNGLDYKVPEHLSKIMFSGEVMPIKQLNRWKKYLPDAMYVNLYGPTEITCNCTYHILDREYDKNELIPIGIPFSNDKVFLLDEDDRLVEEAGCEGEICVSGLSVALGYFRDPEKTKASFVQNPLNQRYIEIIYRTGDLGKYDSDGLLYYTSRKDFQIKHMGQRIELTDIEVTTMSIDGVMRTVAQYDFKKKKIVLFVMGDIDRNKFDEELRSKLPEFMMPGKTVVLDNFPMNKNGKIDRKALMELV